MKRDVYKDALEAVIYLITTEHPEIITKLIAMTGDDDDHDVTDALISALKSQKEKAHKAMECLVARLRGEQL